ncbi:EamA family transporter [Thermaerobacter sp. PB12/4term]|uniref:EamA family transporter n=1 Tax=Thermaerobacter sp. PB12/4term TaxID=2293838 RepID=UPI001FAD51A6|nr:EamA family transporter [Thermaerobacter sp. PB12/4term]
MPAASTTAPTTGHPPRQPDSRQGLLGATLGLLAVALFSLTLPATRLALEVLPPGLVGPGRAAGAAVLAALAAGILTGRSPRNRRKARNTPNPGAARRCPGGRRPCGPVWPPRDDWPGVLLVAFGTVTVFPWFSTLALTRLPSAHGAVLLGLLPLLTSGFATWRAGERPSGRFWMAALAGSGVVTGFAVYMGAGKPRPADLWMLAAIVAAAAGHAAGGRLARRHSGSSPSPGGCGWPCPSPWPPRPP